MKTVTTGLPGLDKLIGGGFPDNTTILVSGNSGSGKTLFSLNYLLDGAVNGEKVCYVSLSETRDELLRACDRIDSLSKVRKHVSKNFAIEHIHMDDSLTTKKFTEIIDRYPRIDRLVVDNVNKLLMFSESKKAYRIHLSNLVKRFRRIGCTLLLCESNGNGLDSGHDESFEVDGVIQLSFLDFEEKPVRSLSVHKMRYTSFDPRLPHEFVISRKGLELSSTRFI
jgi:circadian clock protein KaiC